MPRPCLVALGEVLWDLLPTGPVLGGAPANVAFHGSALGARAAVISRVGADDLGRDIRNALDHGGLDTEGLQTDPARPTGTVTVAIRDGKPAYTIHEDVAWDGIEADALALALVRRADALCFGSLAQRNPVARASIRRLVGAAAPEALRVFDVNLRPPFVDSEIIVASLELCNVLKISDEELPAVAEMLGLAGEAESVLRSLVTSKGLLLAACTRGEAGCLVVSRAETHRAPGIPVEVADTIGAGDAFTAALTVGLLAGAPLDRLLPLANKIAAYVCSQPGATPALPRELSQSLQ